MSPLKIHKLPKITPGDIKRGIFIRHYFLDEIREGIVIEFSDGHYTFTKNIIDFLCLEELDAFSSNYFFDKHDITKGDIEILTKETNPELFLQENI